MSIQTELTRIINAKAAIKTAVEGKGVTVPDGTLLDGMAALIESIQAGGGAENVAYGSYTPASDTYSIYYADLGAQKPIIAVVAGNNGSAEDYIKVFFVSSVKSAPLSLTSYGSGFVMYNIATIDADCLSCSSRMFKAGSTYTYLLAW